MLSSTISWLDLTATDRDKVRRVLDLFKEQGTVDELGLGGLRDLFSNALYPARSRKLNSAPEIRTYPYIVF